MPYRHLIGGEAYGVAHKPGDPVDGGVPDAKLQEWLAAGVIEHVASAGGRKKTKRNESQEADDGSFDGASAADRDAAA